MRHRPHTSAPRRRLTRGLVAGATVLGLLVVLPATPVKAQDGTGDSDSDTTSTTLPGRLGEVNEPGGQVAYVTSDGQVLLGIGEATPAVIATDAAIGKTGQGVVSIAPTADLLVYVRADGALVVMSIDGGDPKAVASDVALDAIGGDPVVAWDSTGKSIAYIAVGTEADVTDPGTEARPLESGSFMAPLPQGPLGHVIKVVGRDGGEALTVGDPSVRSMVGINWSPSDPVLLVDSVIPGTEDRYTISVATGSGPDVAPTQLSVDEPDFAPDGSFVVAVGPAKGRDELLRVTLDNFERTRLVVDDTICNPTVSPDGTRIVYGGGTDCSRLKLISSRGGRAFDITPLDAPDVADFGSTADLGWTADGRFVTYPNCRALAITTVCDGPSSFLEPDTGRVIPGPEAVTVQPIRRPLVQDVWLDMQMRGPLDFEHSFLITPEIEGELTDTGNGGILEATMVDGGTTVTVELTSDSKAFVTGTLQVVDAESGIDRTFMILGKINLLGVRIVSYSGVWISTNDLPFATGEFNMAVRRR